MMPVFDFIQWLRSMDVRLSVHEGRLLCDTPAGVLTPALRQEIQSRKSEIIRSLERARLEEEVTLPLIERASPRGRYPLSFAQQRFWSDGHPHREAAGLKLEGSLDYVALRSSVSFVVGRHESLRTTFHEIDGAPVQVVSRSSDIDLRVSELPAASTDDIVALLEEEARGLLHVRTGPLVRLRLVRTGETSHVLLAVFAHIIADLWSIYNFLSELFRCYEAFVEGRRPELGALPVQYGDYACWQRRYITDATLAKRLDHWRRLLAGARPVIPPADDPSQEAMSSLESEIHANSMEEQTTMQLRLLCRRLGVTLFNLLQTAFGILLYQYTGQVDILMRSPSSSRHQRCLEDLIGLIAYNLVIRLDLSGDPTVLQLLQRSKELSIEAAACQEVPFDELGPLFESSAARPLTSPFSSSIALQNVAEPALGTSGLRCSFMDRAVPWAYYDFSLEVWEAPGSLTQCFIYRKKLYRKSTIASIAAHWNLLLMAMITSPGAPISSLPSPMPHSSRLSVCALSHRSRGERPLERRTRRRS